LTLRLEKKEWIMVILAFFIGSATLFSMYYFSYLPVLHAKTIKQDELNTENKLISVTEQKVKKIQTNTFESTNALQIKVPVKPLTDQLVLDLDKAETISGSFIKEVAFTEGNITLIPKTTELDSALTNPEATAMTPSTTTTPSGATKKNDTNAKTSSEILPQGLKKISAAIKISAPSYDEIQSFIKEIEALDRIVEVQEIAFDGPLEEIKLEDSTKEIEAQLVISAFFLPSLGELSEQLPTFEPPISANKENPFATFTDPSQ
jgi:type IV pilus assembly protein PilO